MFGPLHSHEIDYLVIGHITVDITPNGERLGGSAAYAALTARAFGQRPGILTAWAEELPLGPLSDVPIVNIGADHSTTFENIYEDGLRRQQVEHLAPPLEYHSLPEAWRSPRIVHLAPVLGEVSPRLAPFFRQSTLGLTPQGWLRELAPDGRVRPAEWHEADHLLGQADAAVISQEDVAGDEARIQRMVSNARVFAVTEAARGTRIYDRGREHAILAPEVQELDPTGAGDIFAAAFFIRLHYGDDPLEAARVATKVAAQSVEREGLAAVPTQDEMYDLIVEAM